MVTSEILLKKLSPYKANVKIISNNQTIADIKTAILKKAKQDANEYDKISDYFLGSTLKETCFNIWEFLRNNVKNVTESEKLQTVKSPAAIIATGKTTGSDCKNYALFSSGVLNSLVRKGKLKADIYLRFSKYKNLLGGVNDHVFTVAENKHNQYYIDCVKEVKYFNEDTQPTSFQDKKISSMALATVNGLPTKEAKILENLKQERLKGLAKNRFKIDSPLDKRYQIAIAKIEKLQSINGITEMINSNIFQNVANTVLPGSGVVLSLINTIVSTFDNSTDKWKTLVKKLNPLSPQERLNYFFQLIKPEQSSGHFLYTQLYSNNKTHRTQFDDTVNIDFLPALLYNIKINDAFYNDNDKSRIVGYGSEGFIDLSRTKNKPANLNLIAPNQPGYSAQFKNLLNKLPKKTLQTYGVNVASNDSVAASNSVNPLLLVGGGLLAAKAFKLF